MTAGLAFVTESLDRVMGCRAELSVAAPAADAPPLLALGHRMLERLEECWSRFRPDSDISRLNRAGGATVAVDPATVELLRQMAMGVRLSGGTFDPTLLGAIVGLGYGPAWCEAGGATEPRPTSRARWIDGASIDLLSSTVAVPPGVQIDAGAIGKGLAADLVADALVAAGALAARVVVGGDVRVTSPTVVGVAAPSHSIVDHVVVGSGGVATSGIARSWTGPDGAPAHHVIDPRTARPLERATGDDVVQVTVAAGTAAMAEVMATATLVDPSSARIDDLDRWGAGVLLVTAAGDVVANRSWQRLRTGAPDQAVAA